MWPLLQEAEIGAVDFMPNEQRSEVVDFSVPIGQDPVIIFSSAPYLIIKPFLLFQIFSPEVNQAISVCMPSSIVQLTNITI